MSLPIPALREKAVLRQCERVADGASLLQPLIPHSCCCARSGREGGKDNHWLVRKTEAGIGNPVRAHRVLAAYTHFALVHWKWDGSKGE